MEAKSTNEILQQAGFQQQSAKEILSRYSHIDLSEEEMAEAILEGKLRKERRLEQEKIQNKIEENRKLLTSNRWSVKQTESFMTWRASSMFNDPALWPDGFRTDERNQAVMEMLYHYFSESKEFETLSYSEVNPNPSIDKGILLCGVFGCGKTAIMTLFARNQRQVYDVVSAKKIASEFQQNGVEGISIYQQPIVNAINDSRKFYHRHTGICIDDLGAESEKNSFGNKSNVIGDLIEHRYHSKLVGTMLHATTNLTSSELENFYGGRVLSRMKQIFNLIVLPGKDRRK